MDIGVTVKNEIIGALAKTSKCGIQVPVTVSVIKHVQLTNF